MTIGEKIRQRRIELGMSQDALAKAVGYGNRSVIASVENGRRGVPRWKMGEICEALKLPPEELFDTDEEGINLANEVMALDKEKRHIIRGLIDKWKHD